ncbi:hypothetical protein HPB48_010374 [Haemaphysalis longicornis]|uniref:Uncharacterized protein n=1 Tax=Haemaphysalis longicornis TaxID=44386 RepID=A0A9J6GP62_HAELO|nr:hypothetical protein HPB48_010374 [Haemaphysalis longicornis]
MRRLNALLAAVRNDRANSETSTDDDRLVVDEQAKTSSATSGGQCDEHGRGGQSTGRLFLQQAPSGPKATQAPTFYAKAIAAYRKLTTHNLQRETVDLRNVELSQKLDGVTSENLGTKENFPWHTLFKQMYRAKHKT